MHAPEIHTSLNIRRFKKINPSTGLPEGEYQASDRQAVQAAVEQSRKSLALWQETSLKARAALLKSVMRAFYEQANMLAAIISRETGKPVHDALEADIGSAINILRHYAGLGPKRLKPKSIAPDLLSVIAGRTHQEIYHPRGIIGIISPWNYPVAIPVSGLAAALMAGNTVILKPSELTPATGEAVVRLFRETLIRLGLPVDTVQGLTGDGQTGADLLQERIDGIIFTGSARTGRKIRETAAKKGVWCSLELGGSDAMLVLEGGNLEKISSYVLWGRFTNTGQACASVKRLFVPRNDAQALQDHLQAKVAQLLTGPPDQPKNHIGPLISETQLHLLEAQVQDAIALGATVLCGGKRMAGPGYFYEPTLLSNVPKSARVMNEEVFGPVLPIIAYENVDQAIQQINDSEFGLTASLFGPQEQAQAIAPRLACGTVTINEIGASNYAMVSAPWGGWKSSGSGASHGERALLDLSQTQIVSINRFYQIPGLEKPLWHFGNHGDLRPNHSRAVLALLAMHPDISRPKTWWAFWNNRSPNKF